MTTQTDPRVCSNLQHFDQGSRSGICGRPAKWISREGRGFCGIHGRNIPKVYLLPMSHRAAQEFAIHRHSPFTEGEWCGPAIRFRTALDEQE